MILDVRDVQLKLFIDEIGVLDEANTQGYYSFYNNNKFRRCVPPLKSSMMR